MKYNEKDHVHIFCSFYTPSHPIVEGQLLLLAHILQDPERQVLLFLFMAMTEYNTTQMIFNRKTTNIYDTTFIIFLYRLKIDSAVKAGKLRQK